MLWHYGNLPFGKVPVNGMEQTIDEAKKDDWKGLGASRISGSTLYGTQAQSAEVHCRKSYVSM